MMVDLARYDDVVSGIYDAALNPERWPAQLRAIAEMMGASRTMMHSYARTHAEGGFVFSHNLPCAALTKFDARFLHEDPFVLAATRRELLNDGLTVRGSDLVADDVLLKTAFYKALWEPLQIRHSVSGVVFASSDARKQPTALSLFRSPAEGAFGPAELDVANRLVRHLSRALGVMFHLRDLEWRVASSLAAIDRLRAAVVLIDYRKAVRYRNRAADLFFAAPDSVVRCSWQGVMHVLSLPPGLQALERSFQRLLDRAVEPAVADPAEHFSEAFVVPLPDGRPGCVVHAAPLAEGQPFLPLAQGCGIVLIYDLHGARQIAPECLRALFGMTPAESRAALEVLQGGTAADMAGRLGVSVNTLKTQMKEVFAKCGAARQVDLLKLLLSLSPQ
jgi:DNA-binding CsgD family transcriptional regulator